MPSSMSAIAVIMYSIGETSVLLLLLLAALIVPPVPKPRTIVRVNSTPAKLRSEPSRRLAEHANYRQRTPMIMTTLSLLIAAVPLDVVNGPDY
jgi:hypothetical protein